MDTLVAKIRAASAIAQDDSRDVITILAMRHLSAEIAKGQWSIHKAYRFLKEKKEQKKRDGVWPFEKYAAIKAANEYYVAFEPILLQGDRYTDLSAALVEHDFTRRQVLANFFVALLFVLTEKNMETLLPVTVDLAKRHPSLCKHLIIQAMVNGKFKALECILSNADCHKRLSSLRLFQALFVSAKSKPFRLGVIDVLLKSKLDNEMLYYLWGEAVYDVDAIRYLLNRPEARLALDDGSRKFVYRCAAMCGMSDSMNVLDQAGFLDGVDGATSRRFWTHVLGAASFGNETDMAKRIGDFILSGGGEGVLHFENEQDKDEIAGAIDSAIVDAAKHGNKELFEYLAVHHYFVRSTRVMATLSRKPRLDLFEWALDQFNFDMNGECIENIMLHRKRDYPKLVSLLEAKGYNVHEDTEGK